MNTTIDNVLNKALNLRPSERAVIAQQLINSLSIDEDTFEQEWLKLSNQRLSDIKSGKIKATTWKTIKEKIKKG